MKVVTEFSEVITDFNQTVKVDILEENGLVVDSFNMTLDDYLTTITESTGANKRVESPLLPSNCIKLINYLPYREDVFTVVNNQQWEITFSGERFKVGFPRLVFKWKVYKHNRVELSQIVAIKKGRITEDMPIYYFPFTHVNENGDVCMGGNVIPNITGIHQLETMHSLFFSAPFSTDYGARTTTGNPVWKLFSEICSEREFPDEILIPKNKTLTEFFNSK